MAGSPFTIEIVTPGGNQIIKNVTYLRGMAPDGKFGIMAKHAGAVIALDVGELKVELGAEKTFFAVSGGVVEVAENKALVLSDAVEGADEIDVERAERSRERSLERLKKTPAEVDLLRAEASLKRSLNRLRIASFAR